MIHLCAGEKSNLHPSSGKNIYNTIILDMSEAEIFSHRFVHDAVYGIFPVRFTQNWSM